MKIETFFNNVILKNMVQNRDGMKSIYKRNRVVKTPQTPLFSLYFPWHNIVWYFFKRLIRNSTALSFHCIYFLLFIVLTTIECFYIEMYKQFVDTSVYQGFSIVPHAYKVFLQLFLQHSFRFCLYIKYYFQ